MKILILSQYQYPARKTGAEIYHHHLAAWMESKGHDVTQSDTLTGSYDVIFTTPFPYYNKVKNRPEKIVFIQHNTNKDPYDFTRHYVIYCANHVKSKLNYRCKGSAVLYPFNRFAGTKKKSKGDKITLINCGENKGGHHLIQLAKLMPDQNFLAVRGDYSKQIMSNTKNIEYIQPQEDMSAIYQQTAILLILSKKEGMPTVISEARSFGIPVIGLTIPATVEADVKIATQLYGVKQNIEAELATGAIAKIAKLQAADYQLTQINQLEWLSSLIGI